MGNTGLSLTPTKSQVPLKFLQGLTLEAPRAVTGAKGLSQSAPLPVTAR